MNRTFEETSAEMIRIEGGTFRMGSDEHYPEERPVHRVTVDDFYIDPVPVTNRQFREFVDDTGYVTFAEIDPEAKDYPGADPSMLKAGSLVFFPPPPDYQVDLRDWTQWWRFSFGACWHKPAGPDSSLDGLDDHPVVHITHRDAKAYAEWSGKQLPTEAEWEYAARGGLDGAPYAWGNTLHPDGKYMANIWQGAFPVENLVLDGYAGTSPVRAFPANGYGLYDMIGNVWEWTDDWWDFHQADAPKACCIPVNPRGGKEQGSHDVNQPEFKIPRRVLKGGSHLCAKNYCQRYRPAARQAEPIDSSTTHIGFRCVLRKMKENIVQIL